MSNPVHRIFARNTVDRISADHSLQMHFKVNAHVDDWLGSLFDLSLPPCSPLLLLLLLIDFLNLPFQALYCLGNHPNGRFLLFRQAIHAIQYGTLLVVLQYAFGHNQIPRAQVGSRLAITSNMIGSLSYPRRHCIRIRFHWTEIKELGGI